MYKAPFFRSAFNYDRNQASDEAGLMCEEETLAKQSFKEECDINTIVRRFNVTGELPTDVRMPTFGDFTGVKDFHSAANAIAAANEAFDAMPAEVRARFRNDPALFVDFCSDEGNREEAVKLGLVKPRAPLAHPPATPLPAGDLARLVADPEQPSRVSDLPPAKPGPATVPPKGDSAQ